MGQFAHWAVLELGDGAGAGIGRRFGDGFRREQPVRAKIHRERGSEALAVRAFDKPHLSPAGGTERTGRFGRLAAMQAGGRKQEVRPAPGKASPDRGGGKEGEPVPEGGEILLRVFKKPHGGDSP